MSETQKIYHCLNCNTSENDIPLVNLVYTGKQAFICSNCLPLLIHHPQKLIGTLDGAENIAPFQEEN